MFNDLDDWLILAYSEELVIRHQDLVLDNVQRLGLRLKPSEKCFVSEATDNIFSCTMQAELIESVKSRARDPNCWVLWQCPR